MNTFFKYLVSASLVLLFWGGQDVVGQQAQFLNFWNNTNCVGNAFLNATASVGPYPIPTGSPTISYRINGLWAIQQCNSANTTVCNSRSVTYGSNTGCSPMGVLPSVTHLNVVRFGDANQVEQRITFFTEPQFQGTAFAVDGNGYNAAPIQTRSYFFTGVHSWTHKATVNLNGTCVSPSQSVVTNRYGFTYALTTNIQVGAVNYGCNTTQTTTTTVRTTPRPTNATTPKGSGSRFQVSQVLILILVVAGISFHR